jgi:hypothetical protein
MDGLKTVWDRMTLNRLVSVLASLAVVLFGVVLIAVGELLDWGWTRIIGAGLISAAAVLVGALVGWSDPLRPHVTSVFSNWSRSIIVLLTLIMVGPLLGALLLLFGGLIVRSTEHDWYLMLAGVLTTVTLLGITVITVATAVTLALRGLWKTRPEDAARTNGRSEP